jgi:hypothetical protein
MYSSPSLKLEKHPSAAKAGLIVVASGTTEVVPFQNFEFLRND